MNLVEKVHHRACNLVEIMLQSSHPSNLDELMYDDYDLDYSFSNDYSYDLEEYALDSRDLDEDYARDGQDYETLAYRHYA